MTDIFRDKDTLIRDDVMVEWVELGEGYSGDYDESDPDDTELLRFDISVGANVAREWISNGRGYVFMNGEPDEVIDGEFYPMMDGSYCTEFPAASTPAQRKAGLTIIMNKVYDDAIIGYDRSAQEASWISFANLYTEGNIDIYRKLMEEENNA